MLNPFIWPTCMEMARAVCNKHEHLWQMKHPNRDIKAIQEGIEKAGKDRNGKDLSNLSKDHGKAWIARFDQANIARSHILESSVVLRSI